MMFEIVPSRNDYADALKDLLDFILGYSSQVMEGDRECLQAASKTGPLQILWKFRFEGLF